MNEKRIAAAEYSAVRLRHAAGDLVVRGWDESEILAQAEGDIDVEEQEGEALLSVIGDALVSLPAGLPFHFDDISGDVVLTGMSAVTEGKRIGGNLKLHQSGSVSIGAVGGDMTVAGCSGDVRLGAVGGDLAVESLTGELRASVGGDLTVASATSGVAVNAGGDARVEYASLAGSIHAIQAGGDIKCRLPEGVNATLNLQYGGSLRTHDATAKQRRGSHVSRLILGTGEADVNLMAGGDISLSAGGEFSSVQGGGSAELEDNLRNMADNLESQLGAMAAQLETQLNGLPWGDEIAERITERVERAMERAEANIEKAMRKAERYAAKAERRAARDERDKASRAKAARAVTPSQAAAVSDEERATVLRMVEEGKVSVEQAELLLSAMES